MSWRVVATLCVEDTSALGSESVVTVAAQAISPLVTGHAQKVSFLTDIVPIQVVPLVARGASVVLIVKLTASFRNLVTSSAIIIVSISAFLANISSLSQAVRKLFVQLTLGISEFILDVVNASMFIFHLSVGKDKPVSQEIFVAVFPVNSVKIFGTKS